MRIFNLTTMIIWIQIIDLALHSAFISLYYFADLFLALHSVIFFVYINLQIHFKLCTLYSILRLYYTAKFFNLK